MRNVAFAVLTLALFTAAAACEMLGTFDDPASKEQLADSTLVGPEWQLVSMNGTDVDPEYERPQVDTSQAYYSVIFTDRTRTASDSTRDRAAAGYRYASVLGYPNEAFFTYTLTKEKTALSLRLHGVTEIAPLPGSKEDEFFAALKAATTYEIDGDRLRIRYDDGKTLAFEAASDESQP